MTQTRKEREESRTRSERCSFLRIVLTLRVLFGLHHFIHILYIYFYIFSSLILLTQILSFITLRNAATSFIIIIEAI